MSCSAIFRKPFCQFHSFSFPCCCFFSFYLRRSFQIFCSEEKIPSDPMFSTCTLFIYRARLFSSHRFILQKKEYFITNVKTFFFYRHIIACNQNWWKFTSRSHTFWLMLMAFDCSIFLSFRFWHFAHHIETASYVICWTHWFHRTP